MPRTRATWPELVGSHTAIASEVFRAVRAGHLRAIGATLYTSNLTEPLETIVARNRWQAIAHLVPDAVVSYRTALFGRPERDGSVFLVGPHRYERDLPALRIRVVRGIGRLPSDLPFGPTCIASRARALLDALKPSRRGRGGGPARGITADEAEEVIEKSFDSGGEAAVHRLREEARVVAPLVDAARELAIIERIAGVVIGSRTGPSAVASVRARRAGEPFDRDRVALFDSLRAQLAGFEPPGLVSPHGESAFATLAFFDAYFSNFIEGTEFEVDEARRIVFEGAVPAGRPLDAHDVAGTYAIVGRQDWMRQSLVDAPSFETFLDRLRTAHRAILHGRTETGPGLFKTKPNRAGDTVFVAPERVVGTLRHGFDMVRSLERPLQRAAAVMFVLSEVHPFADGNGRVARAFMNAELVAAGEARVLIPTVFRGEYLAALRAQSRQGYAMPLAQVLAFGQRLVAAIGWDDFAEAQRQLASCHAFASPSDGVRLRLPFGAA